MGGGKSPKSGLNLKKKKKTTHYPKGEGKNGLKNCNPCGVARNPIKSGEKGRVNLGGL